MDLRASRPDEYAALRARGARGAAALPPLARGDPVPPAAHAPDGAAGRPAPGAADPGTHSTGTWQARATVYLYYQTLSEDKSMFLTIHGYL